jgi:tetratricopeptide (TPR) repeat protein
MIHRYLIIFSLATLIGGACQSPAAEQEEAVFIPELLQRPAVIGPAEEMAQIDEWYKRLARQIEERPDDPGPRLALVELFINEARISGEHGYYYPAALKMLEQVLAGQPEETHRYRALFAKATVRMALHQFSAAKETALEAARLNAFDAAIHGVLTDAYVELGMYPQAIEAAEKMVAIRPDLRSYSRISYLREIHGDVPGAIEAMRMAVAAGYPGMEQTEWARLTLGDLYRQYGQLDSAEWQYRLALEYRPNYPFAIAALASVAAEKNEFAEAERLFKQAAGLIPEVGFFVDLAKLYRRVGGREQEVDALCAEILDMLAEDEEAGHRMALEYAEVFLELMDDPDKALPYVLEEYQVRPNNIDVNKSLAMIYHAKGDLDSSRAHLDKAMATRSQDPELRRLASLTAAR